MIACPSSEEFGGGSNESSFLREFILTLNNLRNHPRNPRLLDRLCMPETRFSNIGDGPGSCWDTVQLDNYVFSRIINVSVPTFFQTASISRCLDHVDIDASHQRP